MTDVVDEFFDGLAQRGYEPMLQHVTGTIRFDLHEGDSTDHWRVAIDHGHLNVRHDDAEADTVVTEERATMADALTGKKTVMIAIMRGEVGVRGNPERLIHFQRLFGRKLDAATAETAGR
jgi:alkyl sulfatase BDS1-like metallo-beta-lactamase superfamily hydrolase